MSIVRAKDDKYVEMKFALAGFSKDQISVNSEDEYLTISAEKPEEDYSEVNVIKNNLKYNKFARTFVFPDDYFNFREPVCSFKDGILTVRLNKNPNLISPKKTIKIA
jgi:HSP20 family molecular chaperone IbpA